MNEVPVAVRIGAGELASSLFDPICELYDAVFSVPPFRWIPEESAQHRERMARLMQQPSFGIATAHGSGEALVGFGYGYALPTSTGWWQHFTGPLPPGLADEWEGRTFAVIDLAVDSAWRGRGVGKALLSSLLGRRSEERATLTVQPTAVETQAFYRYLGWRRVGRIIMPPGVVSPSFDVYVLDLKP